MSSELNLNILLAEDNPVNQMVTGKLLKTLGCRYTIACNGLECIEYLQQDCYDLILMDCMMPELDGLEATRRIRAGAGDRPNIPIIALTANAMAADEQACRDAGMDDYIDKPVSLERMKRILFDWAEKIHNG